MIFTTLTANRTFARGQYELARSGVVVNTHIGRPVGTWALARNTPETAKVDWLGRGLTMEPLDLTDWSL